MSPRSFVPPGQGPPYSVRHGPSPQGARSKPALGRPRGGFTQHRRVRTLLTLLEGHPSGLPLEDLAAALRVSTRSARRYLGELKRVTELESIETVPGAAHLWRIKPSERGRTVHIRRTQAYALLASRALFELMKGTALYDELDFAHRQLLQVAQRPGRTQGADIPVDKQLEDRFLFLAEPGPAYGPQAEEIDELFRAVAELRVVSLRYLGKPVVVHPYALVVHRSSLVCVAYDCGHHAVRPLRVEHVDVVKVATERFELPPDFDVHAYDHGAFGVGASGPLVPVVVEFDATVAGDLRARRFHCTQRVAAAPDGRIRVAFSIPDLEPVVTWVLSFGPAARAVSPPALVARVVDALSRSLRRY